MNGTISRMSQLFPLRIAKGDRFCNRSAERALLSSYLEDKQPTALISPRRYGKTSLANKVIEECNYPYCSVDLLTTYDDDDISQNIITGVSELVSQILPINLKAVQTIEKCFTGARVAIRAKYLDIEFNLSGDKNTPPNKVLEALSGLERLATKLNKDVVIFIDEYQRLMETSQGEAIQAAIRNVAQKTDRIAFIFSGSSRHMLLKIFDDSSMPTYMMCEKMFLDRINKEHYIPYMQTAAKKQWKTTLPDIILEKILELTELHPFYVNFLCSRLWRNPKPPASKKSVETAWHDCLMNEERRITEELEKFTINQRVIIKKIANTPNLTEPTSTHFLAELRMSSGTVTPALKALRRKDMIYLDANNTVKVLDPLIKYYLQKI